ncbi:hypothetical protein [Mesorhizobium sp.]|uniref:hypothetical protein n=1 Tax=Mesorhizobium sp. TaxID=1871066 RepID=UPI0034480648
MTNLENYREKERVMEKPKEQHSKEIGSNLDRQGEDFDTVGSVATNVTDGFTMVAVGDIMLSRPITKFQHPGFDDVVNILRNGDVTFGNMESLIFDIRSFRGSPQVEHGGCYFVSQPELGPD